MMQLNRRATCPNSMPGNERHALPNPRIEPVVFVVDDDPLLRKAVNHLFESRICSVVLFDDPRSFLDHLPCDPHGCILLEMNMGEMSGFSVLQELARRGCQLPVIFVSGSTNVATVVKAMKRGAFHFFSKPAALEALRETVLCAIEHDQRARKQRSHRQALLARAALLTPREMLVARLVAAGMLNKQIAIELGIVEKTVKVHRGRAVEKLRVESVAELVRLIDTIDSDPTATTHSDA